MKTPKNNIDTILLILTILSGIFCLLYIFSNRSPEQFQYGSELMDLMNNLCLSIIAGGIFYYLQVYIPGIRKKKIIKQNFIEYRTNTKKNLINIILRSLGDGSYNEPGIVERLLDEKEFYSYFSEDRNISREGRELNYDGQTKWHGFLNGLNDLEGKIFEELELEFELLVEEINYIFITTEINNPEIIMFLKRLKSALYYNRKTDQKYGEEKRLSQFLWELLGGRSVATGPNPKMMEKIINNI